MYIQCEYIHKLCKCRHECPRGKQQTLACFQSPHLIMTLERELPKERFWRLPKALVMPVPPYSMLVTSWRSPRRSPAEMQGLHVPRYFQHMCCYVCQWHGNPLYFYHTIAWQWHAQALSSRNSHGNPSWLAAGLRYTRTLAIEMVNYHVGHFYQILTPKVFHGTVPQMLHVCLENWMLRVVASKSLLTSLQVTLPAECINMHSRAMERIKAGLNLLCTNNISSDD